MFDHRISTTPKAASGVVAAVFLLALAGAYGSLKYWNRTTALQPLVQPNAVLQTQPTQRSPAQRAAGPRDEPIRKLAILVFKSEKKMEVWALRSEQWGLLRQYPVLAASGAAGPKLREGDRQVPEGIYRIVKMNPNSRFHRSFKIDYPNAFDTKMAERDGRVKLGDDICVHGKNCSSGCVAIGDPAIEDLFALVEQIGPAKTSVIIAPNDLRDHIAVKNPYLKEKITWLNDLYATISAELKPFSRH